MVQQKKHMEPNGTETNIEFVFFQKIRKNPLIIESPDLAQTYSSKVLNSLTPVWRQ